MNDKMTPETARQMVLSLDDAVVAGMVENAWIDWAWMAIFLFLLVAATGFARAKILSLSKNDNDIRLMTNVVAVFILVAVGFGFVAQLSEVSKLHANPRAYVISDLLQK